MPTPPQGPNARGSLFAQAQSGDRQALERLLEPHTPALRQWVRTRIAALVREAIDTHDLVREGLEYVRDRFSAHEPLARERPLEAPIRTALEQTIRDELATLRLHWDPAAARQDDDDVSRLERLIGREHLLRYEAALGRLAPADREAIVAGIEIQLSDEDLALALEAPTAEAARQAVVRAILRLADEMSRLEDEP